MGFGGADRPVFSLDVSPGDDGEAIVTVAGELDLASADQFAFAVADRLSAGPVLIDLSRLTFMDSAGVRAMNSALRSASQHGHELRVAPEMDASVVQVLELTGMMGLLRIEGRA